MLRNSFLKKNPIPFFFRMQFLSNNYRDPMLRQIEREHKLTRPEFSILVCLALRDGLSAIDIAEITRQPENTVSRGVFLLLQKKLIEKIPDPTDGRRFELSLTEAGKAAYEAFMPLMRQANAEMIASLDKDELKLLDKLLDKMCAAVRAGKAWDDGRGR